MNLRFPEIFGGVLLAIVLSSFAMPRALSMRIENSFQFVFAPIAGPIQWVVAGKEANRVRDEPLFPQVTDEVQRLRQEKMALEAYTETLRGQIATLMHRQAEAEAVGERLGEHVTAVKVIAADAAQGRDYLRLWGTTSTTIRVDQAVVTQAGLVGKIIEVGVGHQPNVRLITDKGFKLVAKFGRFVPNDAGGLELIDLPLGTTIVEGVGNGTMKAEALRLSDVTKAGLKPGDLVFLGDTDTQQWPIEVHGTRIGTVTKVGEKLGATGVAEIWIKPAVNLSALEKVLVVNVK